MNLITCIWSCLTWIVIFVSLSVQTVQTVQAADTPMNLVFILADNQSSEALAVYGNRDVETPNIDRLAAEGIRFDRAFAVNGLCSATRATLMTGLIPSAHGMHDAIPDPILRQMPDDWNVVKEYPTLPQILANRGYRTAMVGKWHLGQYKKPQIGYQYWVTFPYGHTLSFWDNQVIDNGKTYPVKDRHIVDFFTEKAVEFIDQQTVDRPFYLQLNYDGPYANPPTNYGPARNRHYSRYVDKAFLDMPIEPISDNILKRLNGPWRPLDIENLDKSLSNGDIWTWLLYEAIRMQGDRESYANFLSQNSMVDDGVGKVLVALERQGLLDNTLIVYSADQGNHFGQHGIWGHTNYYFPTRLYDTSMRIPLIIRSPVRSTAGSVNNSMIGQYDLMPTLLAALNVSHESHQLAPGRDFSPMLRGEESAEDWPDVVFFEQEESRGIRTPEYLYWQRHPMLGESALFDLRTDPGQRLDVAGEAAYAEIRKLLDRRVTEFFELYSDPKYDLWKGGTVKGFSLSPWKWKKVYGEGWGQRPTSTTTSNAK